MRDRIAAVSLLENLARNLSLAESRQLGMFDESPKRALLGGGELVVRDGNLELDLRGREPVQC